MTTKKKSGKALATLPVAERAVVALGMREREQELVQLAASTTTITAITNPDGYKQVRSARIALKNERLAIQKAGKDARDDATKFSKAVIAEENRLVALIEPEEKRLGGLQDAEDARIEAERQAEIEREMARQAALQERVAELRGNQMLLPTSGADLIAEHISDLEAIAVDESFEELREQAEAAKSEGLTRLRELHLAAIAYESEQRRIAEERAELARLRQEAAERAAADAERERQAKVTREAEEARHAAHLKRQADEAAREQAARQRLIDDENERKRAEIAAEEARQAEARAEIERQQEELRKASEPVPPAFPTEGVWLLAPTVAAADAAEQESQSVADSIEVAPPTRDELIAALTSYYGVDDDTVLSWLASHDWRAALTEMAA